MESRRCQRSIGTTAKLEIAWVRGIGSVKEGDILEGRRWTLTMKMNLDLSGMDIECSPWFLESELHRSVSRERDRHWQTVKRMHEMS